MFNLKATAFKPTVIKSTAIVMASISLMLVSAPVGAKALSSHSDSVPVSESIINGKTYSVTKVTVNASSHDVWRVLTNYANAENVFPQMKKCTVLQDMGTEKIVKHTVAPSGPAGTYTYTLKIKEKAPHLLEWNRISGAFKEVKGFWKLEGLDNGRTTLVTYACFVDGGFLMPGGLIRRQNRIDMPQVLRTLKHTVESKVQIAEK